MEAEKLLARLASCYDTQERLNALKEYGSTVPEELSELIFIHLDIHMAEKNYDMADELVKIGEEFTRVYREPVFAYQLFKKKAKLHEEKGDTGEALSIYQDMITLSMDMNREDIEAEMLMESGIIYEKSGDTEEALERFLKASGIYKKLGHNYNYAASLFNIAYIFYNKGDLDASISYCQQALQADDAEQFHSLEAHVNLEFANIYESRKEMLLSKLFYQKALEGYQKGNDKAKVSDILYKIGAILNIEKRTPLSEQYYQKALHMKMDIDYTQALADYYYLRARVFKDAGLYMKAIRYLDKAYTHYSQLGQEKQCLKVKYQLYTIFCKSDDRIFFLPEFIRSYKSPPAGDTTMDKAVKGIYTRRKSDGLRLQYFRNSEGRGESLIDRKLLSSLLRDLSRIYYQSGNTKKYKFYSQQYRVIKEYKGRNN
ncbi:MAG: tetratricopeptide repeat protein [Candidatus Xenobiia bacterium LiM19]